MASSASEALRWNEDESSAVRSYASEHAGKGSRDSRVFGEDGLPSFPLLCFRLLHRTALHPVVYMLFDVLRVEGEEDEPALPERRALLEALDLRGRSWHTPESFQDGEALFAVVCERGSRGHREAALGPLLAVRTEGPCLS